MSTLGFAAVPVELAIDFAAETAAEWGKTKGTELKIDSGVLTLNGTNWDSKAFKSVILTPDLRYKLTGTGRGKVVVRLHVGWSRAFAGSTSRAMRSTPDRPNSQRRQETANTRSRFRSIPIKAKPK